MAEYSQGPIGGTAVQFPHIRAESAFISTTELSYPPLLDSFPLLILLSSISLTGLTITQFFLSASDNAGVGPYFEFPFCISIWNFLFSIYLFIAPWRKPGFQLLTLISSIVLCIISLTAILYAIILMVHGSKGIYPILIVQVVNGFSMLVFAIFYGRALSRVSYFSPSMPAKPIPPPAASHIPSPEVTRTFGQIQPANMTPSALEAGFGPARPDVAIATNGGAIQPLGEFEANGDRSNSSPRELELPGSQAPNLVEMSAERRLGQNV